MHIAMNKTINHYGIRNQLERVVYCYILIHKSLSAAKSSTARLISLIYLILIYVCQKGILNAANKNDCISYKCSCLLQLDNKTHRKPKIRLNDSCLAA